MLRRQISDRAQFDAALASGSFLLIKHSQRCSTSSHAFREYRLFVQAHPEIAHGWIDVVAQRDWAQEVARITGVAHCSPQAIWLVDGVVQWHTSHFEITEQSLADNIPGKQS